MIPAELRRVHDLIPEIDGMASRQRAAFPEISDETFWELYELAAPCSMVHVTGFYNVYQTLRYLAANAIPGDLVECGCFLGGVAIFMGALRNRLGLSEKRIYLYDTFDGPPLGTRGTRIATGETEIRRRTLPNYEEAVRENVREALGTLDGFTLVAGKVEETLPRSVHRELALIRLDTDYYESTRIELETLYPKLVRGGALIVDDYGIYEEARRATDEYLAAQPLRPLLNRIDNGIWAGVKP